MPISARLDETITNKIEIISQIQGLSKSKIIAKSIIEYFEKHIPKNTVYEMGKNFFGKHKSQKTDLSINRKKYLKDKFHEKYSNN